MQDKARRPAGQGHGDAGLRRAQGLPAGRRGGVREPRRQGRGDQEGGGTLLDAQGGVRVEHLDPADHRPGRSLVAAGSLHRPALLLAGREDAAGRDHRRQEDLARDARARSMDFVQKIRKTPIVVNDSRGFFTSRVCGAFISEGHRLLKEGVPGADDRELRALRRHAGGPAVAQRRGRDRPVVEDHGPDAARRRGGRREIRRQRAARTSSS